MPADDLLVPPAVDRLEPDRRAMVRSRFVYRAWLWASFVGVYVNLFVGMAAMIYTQTSWLPAWGLMAGFALLPLSGIYIANRAKSRLVRSVGDQVRSRLGVKRRSGQGGAFVLVVVAFVAGAVSLSNIALGWVLVGLALLGPWIRRRTDPTTPTWVLVFSSGWFLVGGVGTLAWEASHPGTGPWTTIAWMALFPGGLPARMVRRPLRAAMGRDDGLGRLARRLGDLLPAADRARAARIEGADERSRELLVRRFEGVLTTEGMGEALLELSEVTTDLDERRGWLAASARLLPDHPQPFAGLASLAEGSDALAYATFAELNATRAVTVDSSPYTTLRESLEAG